MEKLNDGNAVDEPVEGEKKASTKTPNNENDIANDNTVEGESQGKSSTPTSDTLTGGNNVTDADKEEFVLTIDSAAWFSVSQAQKVFGISRDQLRKRDATPPFKIPAKKTNGVYYFRKSDLQALKAELDAKTPRQITPLKVQVTDTSTTTAIVPAANSAPIDDFNLDVITVEVKMLFDIAEKSVIEIGKRLSLVKEKLPHGDFTRWLNDNFSLSVQTARKYIQVADRYGQAGKTLDIARFGKSHLIEMLALPADETENFIAEKAAAGTPVEEMTIKQLRDEISFYKSKLADAEKQLDEKDVMLSNAENELKNLREKPVDVKAIETPQDYEETKKANAALTKENTALKAKIDTLKGDSGLLKSNAITLMNQLINFATALSNVDEENLVAAVKHFGKSVNVIADVAHRIKKVGE